MKKAFLCILLIFLETAPSISQVFDPQNDGWRFLNTMYYLKGGKFYLPWSIFAESFIGVDENDPLDKAFYEIYNAAFEVADGNCFGMSLLSLLISKEEGHFGFCKPAWKYVGDDNGPSLKTPYGEELRKAITVMQCYQWSHAGINWLIESKSHLLDANYAYERVQYYLSKGDLPIITITESKSPLKKLVTGHSLVAYKCEEINNKRYIYVYDPNRYYPKDKDYYSTHQNYIDIDPKNVWSFWKKTDITGNKVFWSSGAIFATPISVVEKTSRNPLKLGAASDELNTLFFSGASLSQLTDGSGHQLYKTLADEHISFNEIEDDPSRRLTNATRLIGSWGSVREGELLPEVYVIKGNVTGDLHLDIFANGDKYKSQCVINGDLISLESGVTERGYDRLEFRAAGTDQQEFALASARSEATFSVELYRSSPQKEVCRLFRITNLQVDPASPVQFRIAEDLEALLIRSKEKPIEYDLELIQTVGTEISTLESKRIKTSPLEWQKLAPSNWMNLKEAKIKLEKAEIKKSQFR